MPDINFLDSLRSYQRQNQDSNLKTFLSNYFPKRLLPVLIEQKLLDTKIKSLNHADLKNINLLSAGANYGINTVGSSLRNPNLQLRSEPIIPKTNTGPWNNTTIEADTYRRALEIDGCD